METALKRILTPRTSTDILRDGRPYSFVFIGVNGVGKSTNLSKVCFWLNSERIWAVEQLRVHVRNLTALESGAVVDLYERGYGKDSAAIAKDAINYAKQHKYDVVLVDTAGRMQDNEPLCEHWQRYALINLNFALVALNTPDKIIFVGEALVGNESVDQLTKFNQALRDFSGMANPRQVDGIILTKFDTVDDKVGAALSMTYITGQPILFVGTGQTYTDLKRMNVKSIVSTLLN
ncbi:signal recognition particle, SRP54 subunit, GTPase domain-containing protein [Chytridium lagenaria]|nr:signal recognition particle, SRP54 subunit, GTPase domain-containing protein [Chytridium lagenaria]